MHYGIRIACTLDDRHRWLCEGQNMSPKVDPRPARLELRGICKTYPTVRANDGIGLLVKPGEIHAVLGENGAGKSTLMKIIYGVVRPDAGDIRWEGKSVTISNPAQARRLGIGKVFQHFSLFETLTAAENIALGLPGKSELHILSSRITTLSDRYGLPIDPRRAIYTMSVGERQRVEIIRALLQNPRLLIMDEPTSVLAPQAVEKLFDTLRQLAREGCSILYISHKLDEIKALCDTATILRGGKVAGVCDPRKETASHLARMMIGKDIPACQHAEAKAAADPLLTVRHLSVKPNNPFGTELRDISFALHGGEIAGIAGVSGNGQRELMAALSGETPLEDPSAITLLGVNIGGLDPRGRRNMGVCFVPEERLGRGVVPSLSLVENTLLTVNRRPMVQAGMMRFKLIEAFAQNCISKYDVRCSGTGAAARSLSGGNLQKFIVGREILQRPNVLLIAQPTWGVDIGAAAFIRQSLIDLRNSGTAILVVSEELDELFEICDRMAVMADGRLSSFRRASETDVTEIGLAMTGLWSKGDTSAAKQTVEAAQIAH
jgi:general nucleoside transport system ATP-binding protein